MNTKRIKLTKKNSIKDSKLRAIRNNLRTIVKLAVLDEYHRLTHLGSLYLEKLRVNKKLTPSQFKRTCQLHDMKEYLITIFSNSICVCASSRAIGNPDTTGDRVRYSLITEFDKDCVKNIGARYYLQEQWFSSQYYEENSRFLEDYLRKMKNRIEKYPGRITTPLELHKLRRSVRQDDFGEVSKSLEKLCSLRGN